MCRGTAAPGSGCDDSGEHTVLFRLNIPESTSPEIQTVVTSATLKLFTRRRRRHGLGRRPAKSPAEDIVLVTVYQLTNDDQWRQHADDNGTKVTGGPRTDIPHRRLLLRLDNNLG